MKFYVMGKKFLMQRFKIGHQGGKWSYPPEWAHDPGY
jgi:hypothetical protein